jgi:hypothetical protein
MQLSPLSERAIDWERMLRDPAPSLCRAASQEALGIGPDCRRLDRVRGDRDRARFVSDGFTDLGSAARGSRTRQLEIRAADYARDAIVGFLQLVDDDEIALSIRSGRADDIVVHFPRIGFDLKSARQT